VNAIVWDLGNRVRTSAGAIPSTQADLDAHQQSLHPPASGPSGALSRPPLGAARMHTQVGGRHASSPERETDFAIQNTSLFAREPHSARRACLIPYGRAVPSLRRRLLK